MIYASVLDGTSWALKVDVAVMVIVTSVHRMPKEGIETNKLDFHFNKHKYNEQIQILMTRLFF